MKKPFKSNCRTVTFMLAVMMLFIMTGVAHAAPQVIVDGRTLSFDVPPSIENGRTLVPLRVTFDALGAAVDYSASNRTITATKGSIKVVLTIDSKAAYVNDKAVTLDVPAKIVNGRTLVPLRFVSQALGASVDYSNGVVTIISSSSQLHLTSSEQIKVHFIDVGQGDSIYIDLPSNNDILIDAGDNEYGQTVVSYLKSMGVDDIELLVATHPHADHIGGLDDVLAAFQVEEVVDSGVSATNSTYQSYWSAVQSEKCKNELAGSRSWIFGSVRFNVLSPVNGDYSDVNDSSVVTMLDCGDIEMLFTGDMESLAEQDMLSRLTPCEILKVSHHGSASSTSEGFLAKVQPQVAIISVGSDNQYGHPAAATLQNLNQHGVKIYRTDLQGSITVTTDGKDYAVMTEKTAQRSILQGGGQEAGGSTGSTVTQSAATEGHYIASTKGGKYHLPSCRYATSIDPINKIWFNTEAQAMAAGYNPCSVCKP